MVETSALRTSPLHDRHVALGAKLGDFGGWQMPLEYEGGGVIAEHTAVREAVGVFDVSHLGKALVRGPGAAEYVNGCLANDLGKIGPGKAQYTLCCDDETGGVVDDLIVYLRGDDEVFCVPNAANTEGVVRLLAEHAPEGVEVVDQHTAMAVLAVQGPRSPEVVEALGLPADHPYMSFVDTGWQGRPVTVCRSGYTGERGYELVVASEEAGALWDAVLAAGEAYGIRPCGLGARDTLRTEMGLALHGQDLSLDITPVQARLGWAVGWGKERFWGRDVLVAEREAGPRRRSWGLEATGRGIPRPHMTVLDAHGEPVGEVTSGTFSPTRKVGIGLALLDTSVGEGDEVSVDVRGRAVPVRVVKPPFVQSSAK
jgi:aminomethyltransferase